MYLERFASSDVKTQGLPSFGIDSCCDLFMSGLLGPGLVYQSSTSALVGALIGGTNAA